MTSPPTDGANSYDHRRSIDLTATPQAVAAATFQEERETEQDRCPMRLQEPYTSPTTTTFIEGYQINAQPRRLMQVIGMTMLLWSAVGLTGCTNAAPGATNLSSPASPASPASAEAPTPSASLLADAPAAECNFTPTREIFDPKDPENNGLFYIKLTNTASTGCQLSGYPDAALVNSSRQPVGGPASQLKDIPDQVVSVEPGGAAYVLIGFRGRTHFPNCNLVGADAIRIRIPQTGQNVLADVKDLAFCDEDTAGWLVFNIAPTKDNIIS